MNTLIKSALLVATVLALGACVYDPGYGYVRGSGYYGNGYYGDAYYGRGSYYDYDDSPGYYPGYYGGYYGYTPSIGLGLYYSDHGSHYGHGSSHHQRHHGRDSHFGTRDHHRR